MSLPNVCLITATCGRHFAIERVVRFFIDQDYNGNHSLLIYNNSEIEQQLANLQLPANKRIVVISNSKDLQTGEKYQTLGAIYRDALTFVPENVDVVNHADDDDFYLPYHVSEGVKGYMEARRQKKKAYKPEHSFYRDVNGVHKAYNTLEPSIFVSLEHLKEYGYGDETSAQHMQWIRPLAERDEILVDPLGRPTFIYTWLGEDGVFKTSGAADNPNNFQNYRNYSQRHGDKIITPISAEDAKQYYWIG
jgi:hypothetical protein